MRPTLRLSIAIVTVGLGFLMLSGQTQNDTVVAQGRKPVTVRRFYTGKDGLSHVENIEVSNFTDRGVAPLLLTMSGAEVHRAKPDGPNADFGAFHAGPRRQYIFEVSGHEEIEFSGGEKITTAPGDIELIEDLPPTKGHRNRNTGTEDHVDVWVTIADQTIVRDSILK